MLSISIGRRILELPKLLDNRSLPTKNSGGRDRSITSKPSRQEISNQSQARIFQNPSASPKIITGVIPIFYEAA